MTVTKNNYRKTNSVNPLYLFIDKIYCYIEESKVSKCLTVVPTDESKDMLKNRKAAG